MKARLIVLSDHQACCMFDGEVGVITSWFGEYSTKFVGRIVQAYGDDLVELGKPSDEGWPNRKTLPYTCKVRQLLAPFIVKFEEDIVPKVEEDIVQGSLEPSSRAP